VVKSWYPHALNMRTRNDFYKPGVPAPPGEHYGAFVRFARRHAGTSVLDLGCGFGAYSCVLAGEGWKCVGCDINIDYLRAAALKGLPVVGAEHVADVEKLLAEAFRVARKNVLITVPNSENIEVMQENDVTYAHMLSSDHLHFFEPPSLEGLLRRYSKNIFIERSDPILPFWFVGRSLPFYGMKLLFRLGILKPRFFSRLYAVASVRED